MFMVRHNMGLNVDINWTIIHTITEHICMTYAIVAQIGIPLVTENSM